MTRSLSPKIPVVPDEEHGFAMNVGFVELVLQNLKMIILTNPGERVMEPNFGVGLKKFLFEQNNHFTHGEIKTKIINQVKEYMPFVSISQIYFFDSEKKQELPDNYLSIIIDFYIIPLDSNHNMTLYFDPTSGKMINGLVEL
jgi:phage baseplate assembly protein W